MSGGTERGGWRLPRGHDWLVSFIRRYKEESYAGYLLAAPYLLYMLLLFFLPLAYMLLVSVFVNVPAGTMKPGLTLANYAKNFA